MYHTIVIPLDGSNRAEAILPHVEELAARFDAKLVFVRVMEPPVMVRTPEGGRLDVRPMELERQEEKAKLYLKGMEGEFREKGFQATSELVYGSVVESIINVAERKGADLIALASHGRTGLSQVFYGSVAAGVLQRIDRPLLLIRSMGEE
jgi:nucleotide-binding universal stress UspA family protein